MLYGARSRLCQFEKFRDLSVRGNAVGVKEPVIILIEGAQLADLLIQYVDSTVVNLVKLVGTDVNHSSEDNIEVARYAIGI